MSLDHISIICVNHKNTTLITKLYGFFEAKITHLYLKSGMMNECKSLNSYRLNSGRELSSLPLRFVIDYKNCNGSSRHTLLIRSDNVCELPFSDSIPGKKHFFQHRR